MNTKLIIISSIIAGFTFAGCQLIPTVTNPESSTQPIVESSPKSTTKPTASPSNKDEAEVNSIGNEFDKVDTSKDFPDVTQQDFE